MSALMLPPCGGCKKREVGCHISCKRYIDYKNAYKELIDSIKENKQKQFITWRKGKKRK